MDTSGIVWKPGFFISVVLRIMGLTGPSSNPVTELFGAIESLYFLYIVENASRVWLAILRLLSGADFSGEKWSLRFVSVPKPAAS